MSCYNQQVIKSMIIGGLYTTKLTLSIYRWIIYTNIINITRSYSYIDSVGNGPLSYGLMGNALIDDTNGIFYA